MTITITHGGKIRFGENDQRIFSDGDVHELHPAHEKKLIDAGMAREGGVELDQPIRKSKAMNPVTENKAVDPVAETKAKQPSTETKAKPRRSKKVE